MKALFYVLIVMIVLFVNMILIKSKRETYEMYQTLPAFVISIPNSKRRPKVEAMFRDYRGPFMFLNGVIAKTDEDRKYHLRNLGRPESLFDKMLTKGELGCALAHVYAYKYIVENKIPRALIMEDDIEFAEDGVLEKLQKYRVPQNEPHITFLHDTDMYGLQAQVITLDGARFLYNNRDKLICDAVDMVIWHKRIPVEYTRGPAYFKHGVPFNDPNTSERIQLNHNP